MQNSDVITIESNNSLATIHKFGATIISWKVDGQEKLFVSSKAVWNGTRPIRGGIPIVFPQFGTGSIMTGQHGFARNQVWKLEKVNPDKAICTLEENDETLAVWPYKFKLTLIVSVSSGELKTELWVKNPLENQSSFKFTALLHTYFAIDEISTVKVYGFEGVSFRDKLSLNSMESIKEIREKVTIDCEVDRTYIDTPSRILLTCKAGEIEMVKFKLPDVVLWNPWIEKSKAMNDFEDCEYQRMICVEAGKVGEPIELTAGSEWMANQVLRSLG